MFKFYAILAAMVYCGSVNTLVGDDCCFTVLNTRHVCETKCKTHECTTCKSCETKCKVCCRTKCVCKRHCCEHVNKCCDCRVKRIRCVSVLRPVCRTRFVFDFCCGFVPVTEKVYIEEKQYIVAPPESKNELIPVPVPSEDPTPLTKTSFPKIYNLPDYRNIKHKSKNVLLAYEETESVVR